MVCNGCTDQTAEVARRVDPLARVIEIPQPSKAEAVRVGNAATDVFPRVHLDADIELNGRDVMQLLEPITRDHVLGDGPRRDVPRTGCSRWVRWYYDVWESLPQVESGLFGRGVVVLSEQAQARVTALPRMMSDDLGMSDSFSGRSAASSPVPSPSSGHRAPCGTWSAAGSGSPRATPRPASSASAARRRAPACAPSWASAVARPGIALRLPVFLGVHVAAQLGARRALWSGRPDHLATR